MCTLTVPVGFLLWITVSRTPSQCRREPTAARSVCCFQLSVSPERDCPHRFWKERSLFSVPAPPPRSMVLPGVCLQGQPPGPAFQPGLPRGSGQRKDCCKRETAELKGCVCACTHVCVCTVCALCVHVHACVHLCVHVCGHVCVLRACVHVCPCHAEDWHMALCSG